MVKREEIIIPTKRSGQLDPRVKVEQMFLEQHHSGNSRINLSFFRFCPKMTTFCLQDSSRPLHHSWNTDPLLLVGDECSVPVTRHGATAPAKGQIRTPVPKMLAIAVAGLALEHHEVSSDIPVAL